VLAHAVAVASDVDEVTVVQEPVEEGRRHHLVAQDFAPLFEALVGGEHGRAVLVATADELEEEHRTGAIHRQTADPVDDCR
jgi:hypothetical protein